MPKPTPEQLHEQETLGNLTHRRNNLINERAMLLKSADRLKEIEALLVLVETDMKKLGWEPPPPMP